MKIGVTFFTINNKYYKNIDKIINNKYTMISKKLFNKLQTFY